VWREKFEKLLLRQVPGTTVVGLGAPRLWNTVSALMPEGGQQRWVTRLDKAGFAVSTGSACTTGKEEPSHVLSAMGYKAGQVTQVLRFSSGWETTAADWEALEKCVVKVYGRDARREVCDSLPQLGNGIPFARQAIFTPNNYTHTPLTGYTNQYGYPVYSVSVNFSNLLGAIPTGGSNVYFGFQFGNTTWSTGGGMVGGMTGTNGFQAFPYGSQPTTPGRDFAFKIKGFSTVNLESPQLTISSLSNEQLQIKWPLASDGEFRLQTATNLSPDAVWTDVTYSISTNGAWRSVIFPPTQSSHFFRLSYY
jgi:hypothetical protein